MNKFEWFVLGVVLGPSLWNLTKLSCNILLKITANTKKSKQQKTPQ